MSVSFGRFKIATLAVIYLRIERQTGPGTLPGQEYDHRQPSHILINENLWEKNPIFLAAFLDLLLMESVAPYVSHIGPGQLTCNIGTNNW